MIEVSVGIGVLQLIQQAVGLDDEHDFLIRNTTVLLQFLVFVMIPAKRLHWPNLCQCMPDVTSIGWCPRRCRNIRSRESGCRLSNAGVLISNGPFGLQSAATAGFRSFAESFEFRCSGRASSVAKMMRDAGARVSEATTVVKSHFCTGISHVLKRPDHRGFRP